MSKLLQEIDRRLTQETDPYLRAELLAKRASYLARTGSFDSARSTIAEVRAKFGDGRSGRVTVLLMVAEGVLLHYEKLEAGALDRLMRAQVLAQAGRDVELIALTSAWKAYLEFESSRYEAAARSLRIALDHASADHHAAGSRVAIVLCIAFALSGRNADVQRQFQVGREHAIQEGDQAALDALLYNKAAFGLARIRAQSCLSHARPTALDIARTELNSARNLQHLTRIQSLASYVDLADARLAILEERFEYAYAVLSRIHGAGPLPKGHFNTCLAVIERAYCLGRLQRLQEAEELLAEVRESDLDGSDVDDNLVAKWQLAELSRIDSRFGSLDERETALESARSAYGSMVDAVDRAFLQFAAA